MKASGATGGLMVDKAGLLAMLTTGPGAIMAPGEETGALNWNFEPAAGAFEYLGAGEALTLTYTLGTADNVDPAGHDVTVTIRGINDAPKPGPIRGSVLNETGRPLLTSGHFEVTDADRNDPPGITITNVSLRGRDHDDIPAPAAFLDMLKMDVKQGQGNGASLTEVDWRFNSGDVVFRSLEAGESLIVDYHMEIADKQGSKVTRLLRIEIRGRNTAPVITDGREPPHVLNPDTPVAETGVIHFVDVDSVSTVTTASKLNMVAEGGGAGPSKAERELVEAGFGYELVTGDGGGVVNWHFDLPEQPFTSLPAGTVVTISIDMTINDGKGGVTSRTVEFSITATGGGEGLSGQHSQPGDSFGDRDEGGHHVFTSGLDGLGEGYNPGMSIFDALNEDSTGSGRDVQGEDYNLFLHDLERNEDSISEAKLFVARPMPPITLQGGKGVDFEVPPGTFISTVGQRNFQLSAQLSNGQSLPQWLHFNPDAGRFIGTAPMGEYVLLEIVVRAKDSYGNETSTTFTMEIPGGQDDELSGAGLPPVQVKKLLSSQLQEAMLSGFTGVN